ncbi:MAG: ParB N-terminal domain-containing protein [Candidatus Riflebacteria bacterium]|nr:ParB N-terminal domain-containing protein [Candidatus Riflebacteria bacterium]
MENNKNAFEEKILSEIGTKYSSLRFINPKADLVIERSIEQYGQISPVVCTKTVSGNYELIDGFKRLRALKKLRKELLKVKTIECPETSCKVAIIQFNKASKTISDIEEAMVLQSLFKDHFLSQNEISILVGKHKSWVSRRIALVEKLNPAILHEIGLGLLAVSIARELTKLPRGNQPEVLEIIRKNRINSRNTSKLTHLLKTASKNDFKIILASPWDFLKNTASSSTDFKAQLIKMQNISVTLSKSLKNHDPPEIKEYLDLIKNTINSGKDVLKELNNAFKGISEECV